MIAPKCNRCDSELEEPGGLLFTAPDSFDRVDKIHICIHCLPFVVQVAVGFLHTPPQPYEPSEGGTAL